MDNSLPSNIPFLPRELVSHISSFVPRCSCCNTCWPDSVNYTMEYYFIEDVPTAWMCGNFTPKDLDCQLLNDISFHLQDGYSLGEFMNVFTSDAMAPRFTFSRHFDRALFDIPVDKYTVNYRGVCEHCEHELHFLTGALLLGYIERKSMVDIMSTSLDDGLAPNVVRIKTVYQDDTANYSLFKSQPFFYYDDDLCLEDLFAKSPEDVENEPEAEEEPETVMYDFEGDIIDQLESGYGCRFFPMMYRAWSKSFIELIDCTSDTEDEFDDDLSDYTSSDVGDMDLSW